MTSVSAFMSKGRFTSLVDQLRAGGVTVIPCWRSRGARFRPGQVRPASPSTWPRTPATAFEDTLRQLATDRGRPLRAGVDSPPGPIRWDKSAVSVSVTCPRVKLPFLEDERSMPSARILHSYGVVGKA